MAGPKHCDCVRVAAGALILWRCALDRRWECLHAKQVGGVRCPWRGWPAVIAIPSTSLGPNWLMPNRPCRSPSLPRKPVWEYECIVRGKRAADPNSGEATRPAKPPARGKRANVGYCPDGTFGPILYYALPIRIGGRRMARTRISVEKSKKSSATG